MDRILIVDDDKDIADGIAAYFSERDYQTVTVYNGKHAMEIIGVDNIDAVILDVLMPGLDGLKLCELIKEKSGVPIIFLSVLDGEDDRIAGLIAGGDDYVTKPFSLKELELRVRKRIAARKGEKIFRTFEYGSLKIDTGARVATYSGEIIGLTPLEFDILAVLAANPGQVFTYNLLFDTVWQTPIFKARHNIQVHVSSLRKKINELSDGKNFIKTMPHKGYYFSAEEA